MITVTIQHHAAKSNQGNETREKIAYYEFRKKEAKHHWL